MKKYDVIFAAGGSCRSSMGLREAGLQLLSFPYDWNPGPGLVGRCETVRDGFPHWFDRDALVLRNPEEKDEHYFYDNVKTGYGFNHDFHPKGTFDEQYPIAKAKYDRRIVRFTDLLERSQKILVVWLNTIGYKYSAAEAEAREARKVLNERWPGKQFDILILKFKEGLSYTRAESEEADGIRTVMFDYKDRSPGEDAWIADQHVLAKWFKREYCIDDYRTPEEIAARKKKEANYEYDRWCAKNAFEWMRNKIEYKIYVHLRKRLKKRGLI